MRQQFITQIVSEGLLLTLYISTPPIFTSLVVGLLIALLQAVTQIQEQTLSFFSKMLIIFTTLSVMGSSFGQAILQFGHTCFESISLVTEMR